MDQHSFPYHNPFNLIALLIALIRNNFRDEYDDVAKRESKVLNEEEWKWADGFFMSLYSHYSVDFLLDTGIPGEYVCELQEHLKMAVDVYSCVMYVLVRICKDFSCDKILESKYVKNRPSGFVSLNDNVKETRILVEPKVSSIANPDNHSSVSGMGGVKSDIKYKWNDDRIKGINHEMGNNIYYIEEESIPDGFTIVNIIGKRIVNNKIPGIRLILSPLTHRNHLVINKYQEGNERLFSVSRKDEEQLSRRIGTVLEEAIKKEADIIVLPEMLDTNEFSLWSYEKRNQTMLQDIIDNAIYDGQRLPSLILTPTVYEDKSNTLMCWNGLGELLFKQHKQYSFIYEGHREDLKNKVQEIYILHIPGLGRLAFPICVDLLYPSYTSLLTDILKCTLLICPSFSFGKTLFDLTSLSKLALGCSIIWLNACAAGRNSSAPPKYVGVVSVPFKEHVTERLISRCNMECEHEGPACCFIIDIDILKRKLNVTFSCGE